MNSFKARGIVLKEIFVGESDKINILLLKEYGKISVSAKGARRAKSKLIAGTSLFSYSDFIIEKGKKYFYISQVEPIENFYNLRNDINVLSYGLYFLEIIEKTIMENIQCDEILKLVIKTLPVLSKNTMSLKLVSNIFEIKYLQLQGYMPEISDCIYCNKRVYPEIYFTIDGIICKDCINHKKDYLKISYSTLYTLQYILSADLKNLFNFNISDIILNELNTVSQKLLNEHFNLDFKAHKFIKELEKF